MSEKRTFAIILFTLEINEINTEIVFFLLSGKIMTKGKNIGPYSLRAVYSVWMVTTAISGVAVHEKNWSFLIITMGLGIIVAFNTYEWRLLYQKSPKFISQTIVLSLIVIFSPLLLIYIETNIRLVMGLIFAASAVIWWFKLDRCWREIESEG